MFLYNKKYINTSYSNSHKLHNDERGRMREGSSLRVGSIIMKVIINEAVQSDKLLCVFHRLTFEYGSNWQNIGRSELLTAPHCARVKN